MTRSQSVHVRALLRASQAVGGTDALAAYLHVSKSEVASWMNGTSETPLRIFLKVVDFLMERQLAGVRSGRGVGKALQRHIDAVEGVNVLPF